MSRAWRKEFVENGGYDCMTHAWFIYNERDQMRVSVDLANYGQKACDAAFVSPEAEADAELIVEAFNRRKDGGWGHE